MANSVIGTIRGLLLLGFVCVTAFFTSSTAAFPLLSSQVSPLIADRFAFPVSSPRWIADYDVKNENLTRASGCYPGKKISDLYHAGEDWSVPAGTAVKAVANGLVVYADPKYRYPGNVVIIEHTLSDGSVVFSMYGHLKIDSLEVSVDGKVKPNIVTQGQKIAEVLYQEYTDENDQVRDNSHLHWEIRTFEDGSSICGQKPSVNPPGPGYTFPEHPGSKGYRNPSQYVKDHQGTTSPPQPGGELAARLTRLPTIPILKPSGTATIELTVQNVGTVDWPANGAIALNHISGDQLGIASPQRSLHTIPSGAEATWVFKVSAPEKPGVYDGVWRMANKQEPFGDMIRIALVVIPKDSEQSFGQLIQAMIADAQRQVTEQFNEQWEELKRRIQERIEEELRREAERQIRGICGAAPASLAVAVGAVWWSRRRRGVRP